MASITDRTVGRNTRTKGPNSQLAPISLFLYHSLSSSVLSNAKSVRHSQSDAIFSPPEQQVGYSKVRFFHSPSPYPSSQMALSKDFYAFVFYRHLMLFSEAFNR